MDQESGLEIRHFISTLLARKFLIIGLGSLSFIAAYSFGMVYPKTYTVSSTLLIAPPETKKVERDITEKFSPEDIKVANIGKDVYRKLATTNFLLQSVLKNVKSHVPEITLSVNDLKGMVYVAKEPKKRFKKHGADIALGIIELVVKGGDPELVTVIANSWADLIDKVSREIRAKESETIHETIKQQYDSKLNAKSNLEQALLNFNKKHLMTTKRNRIMLVQSLLVNYESNLSYLKMRLQSPPVNWSAEQEKAAKTKLHDLTVEQIYKIINEAIAEKQIVAIHPLSDQTSISDVTAQFQVTMPAEHESLRINHYVPTQLISKKTATMYERKIIEHSTELVSLKQEYVTLKMDLERMVARLQAHRELQSFLLRRLEIARLMTAEKTSDVRFIAKAIKPSSPDKLITDTILILSLIAGLTIGVLLAMLLDTLKRIRQEEPNTTST